MCNDEFHKRKHIRLKNYDYSQNGMYFVTICTEKKGNILSSVRVGTVGKVVEKHINNIEMVYDKIISSEKTLEEAYKSIETNPLRKVLKYKREHITGENNEH